MSTIARFFLSCLLLAGPLAAAAASPLDGSWDVNFSTRDDETRRAVVEVTAAGGTWTSLAQAGKEKRDPCVGRPFPLKLSSQDASNVVMEVSFSSVVAGCKDRTVTGRFVEPNVIEGKLDNGKPLRMVRRSGQ